MAKGRPPCCKTYGLPLYCVSFVPIDRINSNKEEEGGDDHKKPSIPSISSRHVIALGGGGGEGRSGVPNALLLSIFDLESRSLSDHPVCRFGTDGDVPYRMAMHPGGDGFVCSFPKSCRWYEWDFPENKETVAVKSSKNALTNLEDIGLQLALSFNAEGSVLATGGEDGRLRVFKWPDMEIILDQTNVHASVKDLDFSLDAKYLVSLGSGSPCKVWDLTSLEAIASLQREDGEMFGFARFSRTTGENQMLYVTAMHGDYGKIISWSVTTWNKVGSKKMARDPISAFNVSADGKLLAIGTVEGSIVIMNSSNLHPLTTVKKAHLGIVTALAFSQDCRALVSTSFDSTARVTQIEDKKTGLNIWLVILILIFSVLAYYFMELGKIP